MGKKKKPLVPEVMEIPASQNKETTAGIPGKIRTCAYCRVSTDSEEQETSYNSQIEFYTDYITKNSSWLFVGIYADKGISGKSASKRPQFLKMIKDCEAGKIDMIITKSISRFARNTRDSIFYIRLLRDIGTSVFFEKECLNSMDTNVDLILTILSSIAEEEARNLSGNIKSAFKHNAALGKVSLLPTCYGYKMSKNRTLEIIPREAHIVMRIFNEFANGRHMTAIARGLEKDGIPTPSKKGFHWHTSTIRHILSNEKYIGNVLVQKTFSRDFLSKRQTNNGEVKKWLVKNCHEPIITEEQFERVQLLLSTKTDRIKHETSQYPLSSLIICKRCNRHYMRRYYLYDGRAITAWNCYGRARLKICKNRVVKEDDIFAAYLSLSPAHTRKNLRDKLSSILVDGDTLTFIFKDGTSADILLPHRNSWKDEK